LAWRSDAHQAGSWTFGSGDGAGDADPERVAGEAIGISSLGKVQINR
jgi:hypothetical protein